MKYKVGDRVKIRSWSSMEQEFSLAESMKGWCNKVIIIEKVYSYHYGIKGFLWTDEMIDHAATRIMSIIDQLEKLKKIITPELEEKIIDKKFIDSDIRRLKGRLKGAEPSFSIVDVNFYNRTFRKIKELK